MKQTPINDSFNRELLALVEPDARCIVEVGCSSGALAREYLKVNPRCEYVGVEIDAAYAEVARSACTRVVVGNIETMSDSQFGALFPADCFIFADVLEHLYDPWALLKRMRPLCAASSTSIVACIPNAQHWSVQVRLNSGAFRYEDAGLLDRTHIRWFTRITIGELFSSCGFRIVEGGGRVFEEPKGRDLVLMGIQALAEASGVDPEKAREDAIPFQWIVRAVPE